MQTLLDWLSGNLTAADRVWSALAPALVLSGYFVVALMAYAIRHVVVGPFRDPDVEAGGSSPLVGLWLRRYFAWATHPLWAMVRRSALPVHALTTLAVLLALAAGLALASGRFALGGWLYIISGIVDVIDARLARYREETTPGSDALTAVLDRYTDAAVLVGLAWYYRDTWVLLAVLIAMVGTSVVPYIRARGEASGVDMRIGLMRRAERVIYLGVGCAMSPILEVLIAPDEVKPLHRLAVVGLVLISAATHLTAGQRLLHMLDGLGSRPPRAWVRANRGPFLRNLISALGATVLDFLLVMSLVAYAAFSAPIATAVGAMVGGLINYLMNRWWTFSSSGAKLPQIWRYSFVSLTSALLNSGGVAVLLFIPAVDYRLAWILARIAIYIAWNYPLQRNYVFPSTETPA